ncbi:DUF2334 domain-containing protein [Clostridium cellulovorans]|uniref:DUF2334 domain-containing protein n=1 Tax=Clostridium cellulovorans (strain ATCC 35296 / DSM 3052 / OCM 3 / 743B) TaxID=573061 RepID=D9SNK6_CLOC7|nr:DUF2334 domain-containing protein [Clostridium cellulovorans]ADL49877.1 Protein of unknown function DUF2334 [Clostridium cellulovorans 743B]
MQKIQFIIRYCMSLSIIFVLSSILLAPSINPLNKDLIVSKGDLKVSNNVLLGPKLNENYNIIEKTTHISPIAKVEPLNNITFKYEGTRITFNCELYASAQRYYLPLDVMLTLLGGSYTERVNSINVFYNSIKYTVFKDSYAVKVDDGSSFILRGGIILKNDKIYLSLSDLEYIFNLVDDWNYDANEVSLFKSRTPIITKASEQSGTAALIRLEDVSAGSVMLCNDSLKKMKALADYFYSEGTKFHVAWIPRYREPSQGIDNDLLEISNIANAQFVNMLDYLIYRGAIIGAHGYTHQHDSETSIVSTELDKNNNNDIVSTKKIIQSALETANKLNIPITFFESPHYAATELQQSVIENYFHYIYEPCVGIWNKMPIVSRRNKTTIYVPAPLGYMHDQDVDDLIDRINNREKGSLASFFYHPMKEFDYIKFNVETDGYVSYTYSSESPMHKILKTLKDNNYSTITIDKIR